MTINGNIKITCNDDNITNNLLIYDNGNNVSIDLAATLASFEAIHNTKSNAHAALFNAINQKNNEQDSAIAQKANASDIPTLLSELENDTNFISDVSNKADTSLSNITSAGINVIKSNTTTSAYIPFCVNSGSVNNTGYGSCLTTYGTIYNDRTWTQPLLTSDNDYGVVSSTQIDSSISPYLIFDGVYTNKYYSNSTNEGNIYWQLPIPIKISSCKIYQTNESSYLNRFPSTITMEGSNNGTTWETLVDITNSTYPSSGEYITLTVNVPTYYTHYRWLFGPTMGGWGGVAIAEIKIEATYLETTAEGIKLDGATTPITFTNAFGTTYTLNHNITYTFNSDGNYNIFAEITDGSINAYSNTIYRQPYAPNNPSNNDVWLDTSTIPMKSYIYNTSNTQWQTFTGVPIGICNVENGNVSSTYNFPYNINGSDSALIECYKNDSEWYNIEYRWDIKNNKLRKWCEQGGTFGTAYTSYTTKTITLIKEYEDTNYLITTQSANSGNLYAPSISAKTASSFNITNTNNYNGFGNWQTCGWIE